MAEKERQVGRFTLGGWEQEQRQATPEELGYQVTQQLTKLSNKYQSGNVTGGFYRFEKFTERFIDDAKKRGFYDLGKINQMIGESVARLAIDNEQPELLDLLDLVKTQGGATYGRTSAAQELMFKARDAIKNNIRQRENDEWNAYTRSKTIATTESMGALASLRQKYYNDELTLDEYNAKSQAALGSLASLGEDGLIRTNGEWIEAQKKAKVQEREVALGDVDGLRPYLETARETASITSVYELMHKNNELLSPEAMKYVSELVTDSESVTFNPTATSEYTYYAPEIRGILDAPKAENQMLQQILDKVSGMQRDRTPPKYSAEVALIRSDIYDFLMDTQVEISNGVPYSEFTPAQKKEFSSRISGYLNENQKNWTERLNKVVKEYNEEIDKQVQARIAARTDPRMQPINIARAVTGDVTKATQLSQNPKILSARFVQAAAVALNFEKYPEGNALRDYLFETLEQNGGYTTEQIDAFKKNPTDIGPLLADIARDMKNSIDSSQR